MAVIGLRTLSAGKQDPAALLDNHSLSKNLPQWFDKSRLGRGCSMESALDRIGTHHERVKSVRPKRVEGLGLNCCLVVG